MTEQDPNVQRDFDTAVPDQRIVKIRGQTVDVTRIPARVTLKMYRRIQQLAVEGKPFEIDDMVELVADACKKSNPNITAEWMFDNLEMPELIKFCDYVLEPMNTFINGEKKNGGPDEGNAGTPPAEDDKKSPSNSTSPDS